MDSQLKALVYGMTGSWADAEEIVQEAHARMLGLARAPESENAYLYRVVCNLAHDHLRKEKVRRREYFGPWLPEPVADEFLDVAELGEELTIGFLMLLEALSPAERIVFVLHEVFEFSHAEIAALLDTGTATIRQRYSRARSRLRKTTRTGSCAPQEVQTLLEQVMQCVSAGDVEGLIDLMNEDVVAFADGGGVVSAAIQPVTDPARIATVIMHLVENSIDLDKASISFEQINRRAALVIHENDEFHSLTTLGVVNGRISEIYVLRNPGKVSGIAPW